MNTIDTLQYVIKRMIFAMLVIVAISFITFFIVRVIPADPAAIYLGPKAQQDQIDHLTKEMGLDKPLIVQYGVYFKKTLIGDWGLSLRTHRTVFQDIKEYIPNSLELLILSLFVSIIVGIPLGALSAEFKGRWFDHFSRVFSIFGVSVPSFWIALVFQYIFFTRLGWFPISGQMSLDVQMLNPITTVTGFKLLDALITGNQTAFFDMVPHYILPVITLSLYPIGLIIRMTRSNVLENLKADFIRFAQSNGIGRTKVLFHYALKNAMGPILTVIGLIFSYMVIGSFFVELIYNWPGIGSYAVNSILSMDYPAIMGVTMLVSFVYVLVNLITDLIHAWMDPRIRLGGEQS